MIQIKIHKTSKRLSTDWHEISIRQAIAISQLKMPEHVQTVEDIADPASWVLSIDAIRYARDVFGILTGFDDQILEKSNAYDILSYFNRYLIPIVTDLHTISPVTYKPTGIQQFVFNDVTYQLPKSLLVDSTVLPLHSSKAIEFVESSNIMAVIAELGRDGIKHLPLFVATYCRPEGEEYNETTIQHRAKLFEELPMSVAWELFFCIQALMLLSANHILNFTAKQIAKRKAQLRVQGWIVSVTRLGFIRWLSRKLPVQLSELN